MDADNYARVIRMTINVDNAQEAIKEYLGRRGFRVETVYKDGDGYVVMAEMPAAEDADMANGVVR